MTEIKLDKLMFAVDASDVRVMEAQQAYDAAQKIADRHHTILHDEIIGNDALRVALLLVSPQHDTAQLTASEAAAAARDKQAAE